MSDPKPITIRKHRFYEHPPEDVWTAITDPHALAEWFEPNNHEATTGHTFQFRCDPGICGSGITHAEVLESDAPCKLVWSWRAEPRKPGQTPHKPMTITWTLEARDNGTLLTLEHSGAEHIGWMTRNMMRVGWGYMMKRLIPRVLTNVHEGAFTPGAIPLSKRTYKCRTVPPEYVR